MHFVLPTSCMVEGYGVLPIANTLRLSNLDEEMEELKMTVKPVHKSVDEGLSSYLERMSCCEEQERFMSHDRSRPVNDFEG